MDSTQGKVQQQPSNESSPRCYTEKRTRKTLSLPSDPYKNWTFSMNEKFVCLLKKQNQDGMDASQDYIQYNIRTGDVLKKQVSSSVRLISCNKDGKYEFHLSSQHLQVFNSRNSTMEKEIFISSNSIEFAKWINAHTIAFVTCSTSYHSIGERCVYHCKKVVSTDKKTQWNMEKIFEFSNQPIEKKVIDMGMNISEDQHYVKLLNTDFKACTCVLYSRTSKNVTFKELGDGCFGAKIWYSSQDDKNSEIRQQTSMFIAECGSKWTCYQAGGSKEFTSSRAQVYPVTLIVNEELGIFSSLDSSGTWSCFDLYECQRFHKDRIPHIFKHVVSIENGFLCLDSSLKLFKFTFNVEYLRLNYANDDRQKFNPWKRILYEYKPQKEMETCIEPICRLKIFPRDEHQNGRITCVNAVIAKYYPQLWNNVIKTDLDSQFLSQQELLVLNECLACLMYGKSKFESRDLFSLACILHYCHSEFPELTTLVEASFAESISMDNVFSLIASIRHFLIVHPDSILLRKYLQKCHDFLQECENDENRDQFGPYLHALDEYFNSSNTSFNLLDQQQQGCCCIIQHPPKLSGLTPLFNDPELSDVKVNVFGQVFHLHRSILSNASTFFEVLLNEESPFSDVSNDDVLILQDPWSENQLNSIEQQGISNEDQQQIALQVKSTALIVLLKYCYGMTDQLLLSDKENSKTQKHVSSTNVHDIFDNNDDFFWNDERVTTEPLENNTNNQSQQHAETTHLEPSHLLTLYTYANFYQIPSLKQHVTQLFKQQLSVNNFIQACYWFTIYQLQQYEHLLEDILEFGTRHAREIFEKYSDEELEPYGFILTRLARRLATRIPLQSKEDELWQ
ncbi:hypothetical protein C9374_010811 [Naegleria lovaniensis]|uniref:BTB domain-containing protein n=1 Tax=Naegleria lovaniensis TaxID=51637 RepID=A0AA88KJ44_NAELO|nr:uncharacterized protein C9374_010811 [Naegleria lovaniensis]KAG2374527.1 hypothetical protein C9374_010811 [Naegleria lovaniensis]